MKNDFSFFSEILKRYVIDDGIADKLGALDYPSIVYYRNGYPALYNGNFLHENLFLGI